MAFRFDRVAWLVLSVLLLALTACGEMYQQPSFQPQ